MGIPLAFFHDLGYLYCSRDLLKIIRNGTAIFSGDTCNILWLIISGPDALFTAKYSTVHQLLEMYNSILNSLERKEMSCDFSKAFDKVWHHGLLHNRG
jgi:hypothetical protein